MKIVGIIQKKGVYQEREYDNINLHCTYEDANGQAAGVLTCQVKIPVRNLERVFGQRMTTVDLEALIGKDIQVYFDRWSKVEKIIVE